MRHKNMLYFISKNGSLTEIPSQLIQKPKPFKKNEIKDDNS